MAISRMSRVIDQLRKAALAQAGAELTDGQLLEKFVSGKDPEALEALVQRHGPMVWGVCRRLLSLHDAEDAFQATFLILVRRAVSIHPRAMVGNWLYGVAHQAALNARTRIARRRAREIQVTVMPEPAVTDRDLWRDLQPILDRELSCLPDGYRVAIVLCDLEGKTRKEAARQLGLPEGTVASRLARARAMLAKRLARQGVVLSGGALATMLAQNAAPASLPTAVLSSTIQATSLFAAGQVAAGGRVISVKVAALMEGVLKTMFLTKLKGVVVVLILALGIAAFGGGLIQHQTAGAQQSRPQAEGREPEEPRTAVLETSPRQAAATSPDAAAFSRSADYKALFVRTLGVMAEYFETIDYANQYDGRIEARSPAPLKEIPVITRRAFVNIRSCEDGRFAIEVRINKLKETADKSEVVGRDTQLERVILQRLRSDSARTQKRGAPAKLRGTEKEAALAFDDTLAKQRKFVVVGMVLTAGTKSPLERVEVTAHAGYGTLRQTGDTMTDKDGRFRLIFQSGLLPIGGVAVIHVRKPGWHGWSYGWPAQFTLSDAPLDKEDVPDRTTNIIPGKPSPLEFRMEPAASLKVKLLDGRGKPLANTRIWLTGENLPPGTSVIGAGKTDADGGFAVSDVPRSVYRLVVEDTAGGRGEFELGSIHLRDSAEYTAVATIHEWARRATHVSLKVDRGLDR
jgi:RNA polymerase sigma factor (sigma-70 family)